jgi:hypothetical protein
VKLLILAGRPSPGAPLGAASGRRLGADGVRVGHQYATVHLPGGDAGLVWLGRGGLLSLIFAPNHAAGLAVARAAVSLWFSFRRRLIVTEMAARTMFRLCLNRSEW